MRLVLTGIALVLAQGCFLDRAGTLGDFDAGAVVDTGMPRVDGGPGPDGGPRIDAGPGVDAGCDVSLDRCETETAIACTPAGITTTECAASMSYCESAACVPWACTPESLECSSDGADVQRCDSRGMAAAMVESCSRGCSLGACRPETPCGSTIETAMGVGSLEVDVCGEGDDQRAQHSMIGDDCYTSNSAPGEDVLVRLEIAVAGTYRLELTDTHSGRQIDPVLSIRSVCNDASSQIRCDDDSGSGRNSRMDVDLAAGDYFVLMDIYRFNPAGMDDFECGRITLDVSRR